jgi:hypothetical protein
LREARAEENANQKQNAKKPWVFRANLPSIAGGAKSTVCSHDMILRQGILNNLTFEAHGPA